MSSNVIGCSLAVAAAAVATGCVFGFEVKVSEGRLLDARTSKPVTIRGFNYVRIENPKGGKHTVFAPSAFDKKALERMLDRLKENGCNGVRVFISSVAGRPGALFPKESDTELSKAYMDNFASFLKMSRARGILVMPAFEFLPLNKRYAELAGDGKSKLRYLNRMFLDASYIKARQRFLIDFVTAIKERGPELLGAILAYDLHNEACYHIAYPFDQKEGTFTAANGKKYDLAKEKEELADDAAVHWVDAMDEAIKGVDPKALTAISVFPFHAVARTGPGDFSSKQAAWANRYPFRPLAMARSKADLIDIHFYPKHSEDFQTELKSIEFEALKAAARKKGKVLFAGEFGVFKTGGKGYKDASAAAKWIAEIQRLILDNGFSGCLHWQYDTHEQPRIWNAMENKSLILKALVCAATSKPAAIVTVGKGGVLLRNGKPFRAVGVNYVGAFWRCNKDPKDTSYREGFAELGKRGIPFARFSAAPFYPVEWKRYKEDKEAHFRLLDDVIEAAEKNNVGLVVSVGTWWPCGFPDLVGEPCGQVGNPESKTIQFMRQYATEVVSRYKDSPAVWAWETGNEYSLRADLTSKEHLSPTVVKKGAPAKRTKADIIRHEDVVVACREFAKAVRKIDKLRPITTGHSMPREVAHHLHTQGKWITDSKEEFVKNLLGVTPDPQNMISVHLYRKQVRNRWGKKLSSYEEILSLCMRAAASADKVLFVGEFGATDAYPDTREKDVRQEHLAMLEAIEKTGVPLSALWVFDFPHQDKDWNISTTNKRAHLLDLVVKANKRLTASASGGTKPGK